MTVEAEVLTRIEGAVGRITLNRPQALHALTTDMCRLMTEALLDWRGDPAVELERLARTADAPRREVLRPVPPRHRYRGGNTTLC